MRVHVINLDRSKDRLASFMDKNRHLADVVRFPAVNGANLGAEQMTSAGVLSADAPPFTRGALGSALSHLSLWKLAIDRSEAVTIAEDDALFNHAFDLQGEALLRSLPPNWDIVLWGWNFDSTLLFDFLEGVAPCVVLFSESELALHADQFQRLEIHPRPYSLQNAFGILAYSVSPHGAAKLANHCLPLRRMEVFCPGLNRSVENCTIDVMMNAIYPKINSYVAFPPLAISKNEKAASTNAS
ncbi:MAG: glycosyltransferase family 25 protein [Terracidiphilus sp.]|jgi:GR25 family glycosyltransferase involved in LPS biosynthesis